MNKSTLNKNIITALCGKSPTVFRTKLHDDDPVYAYRFNELAFILMYVRETKGK